jgi:hypothetical protein
MFTIDLILPDEVTGCWRKLHNQEFHNLYSSPSMIRMFKSRKMRWAERVAQIGAKGNPYGILLKKSDGKRPLGSHRHKRMYAIKIDL